MENIRIETENIKQLSNKLSTHGNQILDAYKKDANVALNMGKECLVLTGLNIEEFFRVLERTYVGLNDRIQTLSNFLNNKVAMGYDKVSYITANNFNNELGSQLSSLLGIGVIGKFGNGNNFHEPIPDDYNGTVSHREYIQDAKPSHQEYIQDAEPSHQEYIQDAEPE